MPVVGRPPKSAELRLLEGNPSGRPIPAQPAYAAGTPDFPTPLDENTGVKTVWEQLIAALAASRVLRKADKQALWQLAEDEYTLQQLYNGVAASVSALQRDYKAQQAELKAGKRIAPSKLIDLTGGPRFAYLNTTQGLTMMSLINSLAKRITVQRREFGLTPSSRSGVAGSNNTAVEDIDDLESQLCG